MILFEFFVGRRKSRAKTRRVLRTLHYEGKKQQDSRLVEALNIQAHIVTWAGEVHTLVMHLYSENLACAWIRSCVCWQEHHLFTRLHNTLLHATCEHIAYTLNLVDARDWHTHGST